MATVWLGGNGSNSTITKSHRLKLVREKMQIIYRGKRTAVCVQQTLLNVFTHTP